MKKVCIFTIVAKNYIGLAQILENSIKQYHEDIDFHIVVADEFSQTEVVLPANTIIAKKVLDYSEEEWSDMAFKYSLTEFCTAIKPATFQYFLSMGYDKVIYFDPDIYVFSSLSTIFETLELHDMVLTPHVTGIHPDYQGEDEWAICVTGIFNLGFCAVSNTPCISKLMKWWRLRLINQAFCDRTVGTFTDQKWMDWVPAFLGEKLCVTRHLGMNVAPWNYFERKLVQSSDNTLMVRFRYEDNHEEDVPLVFVHFSGYDYKLLMNKVVTHQRLSNPEEYKDIELATTKYSQELINQKDIFSSFISMSYLYNQYENGERIENFHRRLYNGLRKEGKVFDNPFSTSTHSFYKIMKSKSMFTKEKIDGLTPQNMSGMEKKIKMLNILFKCLYKLMGYKRYPLFIKSLHRYTQPESHTFLIKMLFPVVLLLCSVFPLQAEIPIVAYYGIPLEYSNVNRFKEFKEAGFDVSICFYEDTPVDTLLRILDDAQKSNIQLLISSGWVSVQPHVGIPRLKNHPALYGYFLQDEPWPKDIPETTRRYQAMAKQDTKKPTYVNLLPDYGDGMPREIQMPPYKQYLQKASTIGLPFISFDFYPIRTFDIRPSWYSCLEDIRQESLRTKKPFWAFALCTPHAVYPQPTIESLRLQIYSDLAYGAQAIEYFTYWTPKPTKEWDFHDGPISQDGQRTQTYALVKRMNQELHGLLPLFDKAEVQTVNHMLKIPEGTTKLQRIPVNIKKLKVVGRQGALISTFKKGGHLYMAVVNKDYESDIKLYISAKSNVTMLTKQLKETAVKSSYKIGGGDMLLFKLK